MTTIKTLPAALFAVAALCLAAPARAGEGHPHWGYAGHEGPGDWGHIDHDYAACDGQGGQQSPIDLAGAVKADLPKVETHYAPQRLFVVNNGHTIQANTRPGSYILLDGERYDLVQYHFHLPSEHAVDGRRTAMEVHLVHRSAAGDVAVLGSLIEPGPASGIIESVWDSPEGAESRLEANPGELLPADRTLFRYEGSLTTPPCSEIVHWIVFRTPITASERQIRRFAAMFPMNARPLQPRNRRFLLESR